MDDSAAAPIGTNLRDLGGLTTIDGGVIRPRTLYRSEAPVTLDPARVAELTDLPLRLIVDLRADRERQQPSPWPTGREPEILNLAMAHADHEDAPDMLGGLRGAPDGGFARDYMRSYYGGIPGLFARTCLPELVLRIGTQRQVPVLLHCVAGQDRTGFAVAVLLLAVGVPRAAVVEDYMVTLEHFGIPRLEVWVEERLRRGQGEAVTAGAIEPLLAHAEYLELGLDEVEARHGSVEGYLRDAGVDTNALAALRDTLVTSP